MKKILFFLPILALFLFSCEKVKDGEFEKKEPLITSKVLIKTDKGDILIGLYGRDAPLTVKNFLSYVREGFYKGLIFHRVIPGFVIQGGGFYPKMIRKTPKKPIKLEVSDKLKHEKGSLSMARTSLPDSATSQFFICLKPQHSLDNKYAVFGRVIKGFDVVEKIANVKTGSIGYYRNVPQKDIIIKDMKILK